MDNGLILEKEYMPIYREKKIMEIKIYLCGTKALMA